MDRHTPILRRIFLCKELFTFLHSFFSFKFSMISPLNHGEIHNRNDHNFFQIFLFLNKKNYKKKNLFVLCGQRIPLMATITIKLQEERKILFNIYFEFRICSFLSVLFGRGDYTIQGGCHGLRWHGNDL